MSPQQHDLRTHQGNHKQQGVKPKSSIALQGRNPGKSLLDKDWQNMQEHEVYCNRSRTQGRNQSERDHQRLFPEEVTIYVIIVIFIYFVIVVIFVSLLRVCQLIFIER